MNDQARMPNPIAGCFGAIVVLAMTCAILIDSLKAIGIDLANLTKHWRLAMFFIAVTCVFVVMMVENIKKSGRKYDVTLQVVSGSLKGQSIELSLKANDEEQARVIAMEQAQQVLKSKSKAGGVTVQSVTADNWESRIVTKLIRGFGVFMLLAGLSVVAYGGYTYATWEPTQKGLQYTGKAKQEINEKGQIVRKFEYRGTKASPKGPEWIFLGVVYLLVGGACLRRKNETP